VRRVVPPTDAFLDPDIPDKRAHLRVDVDAIALAVLHDGIVRAVPGDPDVTLVVDVDPMHVVRRSA
jgi:hypothetical protein